MLQIPQNSIHFICVYAHQNKLLVLETSQCETQLCWLVQKRFYRVGQIFVKTQLHYQETPLVVAYCLEFGDIVVIPGEFPSK